MVDLIGSVALDGVGLVLGDLALDSALRLGQAVLTNFQRDAVDQKVMSVIANRVFEDQT